MTKKKTAKALLASVLALVLCLSMLIGTTFAWFTDSVTSANNIIKSGNLDVTMAWADGTKAVPAVDSDDWKNADEGAIFNYDLWEPGYTEVRHIQIANVGSLALKYQLNILANGEVSDLADVIDVYYVDPAVQVENRTALSEDMRIGTLSQVLANVSTTASGELLAGKNHTITIALKMQETAGNEYQNKSIGSDFSVQLLATQLTAEVDSFGSDYDEEAFYGDYVEVSTAGASVAEALKNATAGEKLGIKLASDMEWETEGHHNENNVTDASGVTIDGQGQYALVATGAGVTPIGDDDAPLTLKNLTVSDKSASYAENAWEFSYLELGGSELYCENVVFTDPIMVESQKATFVNCSFVGYEDTVNGIKMNGVWMYNGDAEFINCTFTGTRGMKICDMYDGGEVGTVVIDRCTFNGLTQKPGVAIDDRDVQDMNITIKNSNFLNCQPGDQGLYVYETDNTVPTVSNNTVGMGISSAEEFLALGGQSLSGVYVLTADIDLGGAAAATIGAAYGKTLTVIGNGHTISNATTAHTSHNGMKHHGLFYAYTNSTLNISDLVIKNVTIDATADAQRNYGAGIVVAYADGGSTINLSNVDVHDCTVKNDTPDIGDEAGVYVGYQTGTLNMTDCDSTGCSVAGETAEKTGAMIGMVNGTATLTNCTTDLTIGSCNRVSGNLTEN